MKKLQKIAVIILIISSMYLLTYNSYAGGFGDIWNIGSDFLDAGASGNNLNAVELKDSITGLVDFLWGLGVMIIFISTIVLGIRYMLVLPNEKSRIKQATTPWIIGVVIIFGALTIWKLVIGILDGSLS